MTTLQATDQAVETVADLLQRLGDVSPSRIRIRPPLGSATEADLIEANRGKGGICELVDGVLVEKTVGLQESIIAGVILAMLRGFVVPRNLGFVTGADGMMRLRPGIVRVPDVAFLAWDRFPDGRMTKEPIPDVAPDLAVEVLSVSNTPREMARKCREYFESGTLVVWMIDPDTRTLAVYTGPEESRLYSEGETLDVSPLLPGLQFNVGDLFADLDRRRG